ncbi:MAG: PHP domain-containing protein [Nanoarchaeota archaeon]
MIVDLHAHTYYSDGSLSPSELVALAIQRCASILAVTDHDSIAGVSEALTAANGRDIKVIPGIEISCDVKCSSDTIHLVGLYLNTDYAPLKELSRHKSEIREIQTRKMMGLANKYFKTNITWEDLKTKTRGVPSRPHIAMALLDKGIVKNIEKGIRFFLKGGSCYIESEEKNVSAEEAIKIIHGAGGIAILAHLAAYKNENKFVSYKEQEILINELVHSGLDGIEIYIPGLSKEDKEFGESIVKKHRLLTSGGSDFHDEKFLPENKLGFIDTTKTTLTVLHREAAFRSC